MASPDNIFFKREVLQKDSIVMELGSGVSGILAMSVSRRIAQYFISDQSYVMKLLKQNLEQNGFAPHKETGSNTKAANKKYSPKEGTENRRKIQMLTLDWELHSLQGLPDLLDHANQEDGVDAVLACDCIFNDALIEPFVNTCVEICKLRSPKSSRAATVCIIAQQKRDPEVFQSWLTFFNKHFRVWRVPAELGESTQDKSSFVIHVGKPRH
jgi:hypothetical protein